MNQLCVRTWVGIQGQWMWHPEQARPPCAAVIWKPTVSCTCKQMCWLSKLTQSSQGASCKPTGSPTEGGNWRARESKHKEHGSAPLLLSGGEVHSPRLFYGHIFLRYNALAFASIRKMTKVLVGGWADIADPSFSETVSLQIFMGGTKPREVCLWGWHERGRKHQSQIYSSQWRCLFLHE